MSYSTEHIISLCTPTDHKHRSCQPAYIKSEILQDCNYNILLLYCCETVVNYYKVSIAVHYLTQRMCIFDSTVCVNTFLREHHILIVSWTYVYVVFYFVQFSETWSFWVSLLWEVLI